MRETVGAWDGRSRHAPPAWCAGGRNARAAKPHRLTGAGVSAGEQRGRCEEQHQREARHCERARLLTSAARAWLSLGPHGLKGGGSSSRDGLLRGGVGAGQVVEQQRLAVHAALRAPLL